MNNKYLLREYYELCEGGLCQDFLTENEKKEVADGKAMYLTGVIQRAKAKNQNGRVYPRAVLEREIENYQKIVRENRALGELDHPEDSVVNLKNVSHLMTQVWWDGDNVMGKCKILNTPSGQILQSLVHSGVKLGISSRGMGSVHEDRMGNTIVEDDFNLICFDFVSDPSTIGAFMSLQENRNVNNIYNKADRINRLLNDITRD
tara:strand:+ start:2056 stop:2667 length:612 start_codon:yes stop_codon:yes gene_type:complete